MKGLMNSLRWRLFYIYLLLTLLILFSSGFLVYSQMQSHMLYNRWSQTSELISWALTQTEPPGSLKVDNITQVATKLSETPGPDFSFFLLDMNGELIQTLGQGNPKFIKASFSAEKLTELAATGEPLKIVNRPPGYEYRILTVIWPIYNSQEVFIGAIQSEIRLDEADEALNKTFWVLVLGFFLILIISSALWLRMTRVMMKPLVEMADVSKAVAAGDFTRRVRVPGTRDETHFTAIAFNTMLENVQKSILKEKEIQAKSRQFLADASHELRSPTTVLKGFVDVLQRGAKDDPEELQHSLDVMNLSLKRMIRLINDMLKLSRLEATPDINLVSIDVNALCQLSAEAARNIAGDKQVIFVTDTTLKIKSDEQLLEQALWNLLENALNYTDSKEGKIIVSVYQRESRACISVQDNGKGIAAEHLNRIFERFYRADTSNPVGTGLGLAITRTIIEKLNGEITVQSSPGSGTIFTISFPLTE